MPASSVLPKPQAIVFDLDNTLYPYGTCHKPARDFVLSEIASQFSVELGTVRTCYDEAREAVKQRLGEVASSHSRLLYLLATFERLGFGPRPADALALEQVYWRRYLARMELASGFDNLFNGIKAHKIPLALVTDLTATIQIRKLIALGLQETFDCLVTSEECAGEKKSGASFSLLLEKTGFEPGPHLWMIGDSGSDMLAKKHIGATTILANFFGDAEAPGDVPDATVSDVRKLGAMIEEATRSHAE